MKQWNEVKQVVLRIAIGVPFIFFAVILGSSIGIGISFLVVHLGLLVPMAIVVFGVVLFWAYIVGDDYLKFLKERKQ